MNRQDGLTAVELMVTLFVAALFIISGYQLYNAVNLRAANSREMSEASNIAYRILRENSTHDSSLTRSATVCPISSTLAPAPTLPTNTLPTPVTVSVFRCWLGESGVSELQRVTVQIEYGNDTPKRKVVHATYVSP